MANKKDDNRDMFMEQLQKRVDAAIDSRELKDMAAAQLEVQFAQLQYLQQMDWKLWELYNKFGS
jgi:hypothetical protein